VQVPIYKYADLAAPLVACKTVELYVYFPVNQVFLDAFLAALMTCESSVLETLRFFSSWHTSLIAHEPFCFDSLMYYTSLETASRQLLDIEWVESVERLLTRNIQRRTIPPLLGAIMDAESRLILKERLVGILKVVDTPFLYECIRSNMHGVQSLIPHLCR
jgi:hypothetical protein